jgi:vacuolar-type H+-ATPase subunit E/Vma4
MPLGDLIAALERDAGVEVSAALASAAADAARTETSAQHARADRIASELATARAEQQAVHDARLAGITHRARVEVLRARGAMLERLLPAVRAALPELARDPRVARALRDAAQACAGESPGQLQETPTGVVIELASGIRIDATLDAVLDREWPRLAPLALTIAAEAP